MMHLLRHIVFLFLIAALGLLLFFYAREHPSDVPWTELDLTQPPGAFTGRKLAGLERGSGRCRELLSNAGVRFVTLPPRAASDQCGYEDAVRLRTTGSLEIGYRPPDLGISCPVAAGLALWEWHVVQPAALRHFGQRVETIGHFGSYSCRRLYARSEGAWSEHATANAVDVAEFRLADGTRISVLGDWGEGGAKAAFLRDVRDGACGLFATVLSPDYNAAHNNHLHLDQAARGEMGWRGCR